MNYNANGTKYNVTAKKFNEVTEPPTPGHIHSSIIDDIHAGYEFGRAYDAESKRFYDWKVI